MRKKASIIIRTKNEEKHLPRLLESLKGQNYQDFEIIVVDSGSTDKTLEIASKYQVKIVKIKPEEFTFGRSLNVGCSAAQGEYLVFLSAHTYPVNGEWLQNIVKPFEDQKIAMVYGRQVADPLTKLSEERDLHANFSDKSRILVEEPIGNNANSAVRRDLWEMNKFDEILPGLEDIAWAKWAQSRNYYVYYKADAVMAHVHEESYSQIYNRFKREIIAYRKIFPDHSKNIKKEAISLALTIMRDLYFGLKKKRSANDILSVFPYRLAEFKAMHDAFQVKIEPKPEAVDLPETNRSVVITGVGQHALVDTDIPAVEEGEVLINVKYVGLCSTDLDILEGRLDYYKSGWAKYPIVPGHEFSGIIASGPNVGDKVVGECIIGCGHCSACQKDEAIRCEHRREVGVLNLNGAYSRYIKLPVRALHKLPEDADLKNAALLEPLAVVLKGTQKISGRGLKIAVVGGGTIGNLTAQVMRLNGHSVTLFENNPAKAAILNASPELFGLNGFDCLIEATGKTEVLKKILSESKAGVRILLLGLPYSKMEFNFESVVCFDKTIIGSVGSGKKDFIKAIEIYNKIDLSALTGSIFPLEEYHLAWQKQKEGKVLKALIKA
ncbi:MAG: glycosyltransferase [Candidatus Margulisbacteria bacterium]|nr:glycosyltransferase [Candidatus Margulisiibacteriota bacterium]